MEEKHFSFVKLITKIIGIIILIALYSYFVEPKLLTYKEYPIKNENITDNFIGFKIVHISDVHYGRSYGKEDLNKLVKKVNEQKPDIVVFTGDLIDMDSTLNETMIKDISAGLNKIKASAGKYAISGNHDVKFDEWENIIKNGGFKNLNNAYDTIYKDGYNSMLIAGASSFKDKMSINDKLKTSLDYINSFETDGPIYKILIMHEPDYIDDLTDNKFDLILAGHSHGGQIRTPFGPVITPPGSKKYYNNHYKIDDKDLYISNGLGLSTYNFRLFSVPSFNIYRFVK